jgi:hypothetical protein
VEEQTMRNIFEYHDEDIYLEHHGIKGQKWGIRRFQNPDGSLTEAGEKRYNAKGAKGIKGFDQDAYERHQQSERMKRPSRVSDEQVKKAYQKMRESSKTIEEAGKRVARWNEARDKGRYELDFLEAVQNSGILKNGDQKALLTEYASYLQDREKYWDRGSKLPPD